MQNALRPARETSEHDRRRVPRRPRSGGRPPPPRTRSARRRRHRCRGAPTARRIAVRRVARRGRELRLPAEAAESAIENMVGSIQVPMGVAGPVSVDGGSVAGEKYLPSRPPRARSLASVNRGCSVINSAGGATARVLKSGMTRAPVFRVADVAEAEALVSWTRDNFAALKEAAEETTNHGELLDVTPYVVGNSVYLRFRYDTKDAMGMNMATIATEAVCGVVEAETVASPRRPLGQPLFRQEARRHQRRRGARPERHRRRSNPARGRRRTPAHHARSGRGTQHTQEPGRLREGREPRVQRPRRQRRRRDVPRHRAGRGAGRRGRERHHDRRGAGRRPLRLGLHRLPRSRHRRRRHETP